MAGAPVLAAALACAACMGCARQPRVVNAAAPAVYAQSIKALAGHGFACRVVKAQLICNDDDPDRPTIFVSYVSAGSRLIFVAFDRLEESCDELLPALNRFNYEFDFAQVSCRDDGMPMLFYVGNVVIPEDGLSAKDLGGYASWWSAGLMGALRRTNLVRRGGGERGPRARPPSRDAAPREEHPPSDPSLRKL